MKMFNKIIMTSEFDDAKLKAGRFYDDSDAVAEVEDGAVVSILGPEDHDLYTGLKDLNARKITAYDANAPIYGVVDYVGVSHANVMGVNYRIGDKTAGVYPMAGEITRVRMLEVGDEFYLCGENFDGTPAVGAFAAPAAGKTTWKVAASAAASGLCIEIEDTKNLILGQTNSNSRLNGNSYGDFANLTNDMMYRCRVISV